jgi:hypothetical protein
LTEHTNETWNRPTASKLCRAEPSRSPSTPNLHATHSLRRIHHKKASRPPPPNHPKTLLTTSLPLVSCTSRRPLCRSRKRLILALKNTLSNLISTHLGISLSLLLITDRHTSHRSRGHRSPHPACLAWGHQPKRHNHAHPQVQATTARAALAAAVTYRPSTVCWFDPALVPEGRHPLPGAWGHAAWALDGSKLNNDASKNIAMNHEPRATSRCSRSLLPIANQTRGSGSPADMSGARSRDRSDSRLAALARQGDVPLSLLLPPAPAAGIV